MAPLVKQTPLPLMGIRVHHVRLRGWAVRMRQQLTLCRRPAVTCAVRQAAAFRQRNVLRGASSRTSGALAAAAAPLMAPVQAKGPGIDDLREGPSRWRESPSTDSWDGQPLKPRSAAAEKAPFGGVLFEAEQAELPKQRPNAEAAGAVLRSPKAMLSTLDSLKREDYAIGVIALALGVGVAHATGRVATAVPQLALQSGAAVKGLGAGLARSHLETYERAQQWIGALKHNARKQAAVSQETLKEWPFLVQASIVRYSEKDRAAVRQLSSNVSKWADEMQQTIQGGSAVQSLWQSAASATKRFQNQSRTQSAAPQAAPLRPTAVSQKPSTALPEPQQAMKAVASLSAGPQKPSLVLHGSQQAWQPYASVPARTQASADTSAAVTKEEPKSAKDHFASLPASTQAADTSTTLSKDERHHQNVMPPAQAQGAVGLLPAPREGIIPQKASSSGMQVYAAKAEAAETEAKHAEPIATQHAASMTAKQAVGAEVKAECMGPIATRHGEAMMAAFGMAVAAESANQAEPIATKRADTPTTKHIDRPGAQSQRMVPAAARQGETLIATFGEVFAAGHAEQADPLSAAHEMTMTAKQAEPLAAEHGQTLTAKQTEPLAAECGRMTSTKHLALVAARHIARDTEAGHAHVRQAEPTAAKPGVTLTAMQTEPITAKDGEKTNMNHMGPIAARHGEAMIATFWQTKAAAHAKQAEPLAAEHLQTEPVVTKHSEKAAAKQAGDAWNDRIKGAYAAVAASTPYRPAVKKPSSNALSWHRGGNTTLLKPDFQLPKRGADEGPFGSGSGSGNTGGSGGSGGGGDNSEDPDQPEQNPRAWLWARVVLAASAAAAAAEQALQLPRQRARILAALSAAGYLAYKGYAWLKYRACKNRRKVSQNSMGRFGFGGSRSEAAEIAVGELTDFSDDESF